MLRPLSIILVAGCLAFVGCTPGDCESDSDCSAGNYCFLRSCLPRQSAEEGGAGGSGGTENRGGQGGEVEEEPLTADSITVELFADSRLSKLVKSHNRIVENLQIRAISRGVRSTGAVQLDGPLDWEAATPNSSTMFRLDIPTIEIPLDEPVFVDEPIEITVELDATDRGGAPSLFARAQSLGTAKTARNLILLTLDPAFDYDGDGLPDLDDCAPSGMTGKEEPGLCDGEDSNCTLGLCHLKVPEAPVAIHEIRCHRGFCYVSIDTHGNGLLSFEAGIQASSHELIESDILAFRFTIVEESDVISLALHDESEIAYRSIDLPEVDWEWVPSVRGGINTNFVRGETFLYVAGPHHLIALDPTQGYWGECDSAYCRETSLNAFGSTARELALRPISSTDSEVYVRFKPSRKIEILHMSADALDPALSSTIEVLSQELPRSIEWSARHDHLYVVGGEEQGFGEGAIVSTDRAVTPFALPPGVCPSVARVVGDHLLIADDCQGSLWELPIRESGLPDHLEARRIHLFGCEKPSVLGTQATTRDPILVGCSDRDDRFFVVNRD